MFIRRKSVLLLISLFVLLAFSCTALAERTGPNKFKDIKPGHWASEAISKMVDKKIISGYPDMTFKPNSTITRAEFAKMMVLALNLSVKETETATFKDVYSDNWVYPYVESAKYYLTGFRTSGGDYFRPNRKAAREDMAVALVKALGYANQNPDMSILDRYTDSSSISPNLRKYVAIAIEKRIMQGYNLGKSGKMMFKPQVPLTRAESAVLLSGLMREEKVTYDDGYQPPGEIMLPENTELKKDNLKKEKVKKEQEKKTYTIPKIHAKVHDGKVLMSWNKITDKGLQGYKVVVSKYNASPSYPNDGYLFWITDRNKTSVTIDNSEPYKNGDFGKHLVPGEKYYFSVTAVYQDKKVAGKTVRLIYPKAE